MDNKVEVGGIFLGSGYSNEDLTDGMAGLFGDRPIYAKSAEQLMDILGAFLTILVAPAMTWQGARVDQLRTSC